MKLPPRKPEEQLPLPIVRELPAIRRFSVSNMHCYQCDVPALYLFADGRCSKCTRCSLDDGICQE